MYIDREVIGSLCAHVPWQQNSINHVGLRREHLYELHHNSARVCEAACDTRVLVNNKLISAFLYWRIGSFISTKLSQYCHCALEWRNWFLLSNKYCDARAALANTKSIKSTYKNLVYLNHPISSSSSILCGLHLQIFVQFHVDELYQLAWFLRFFGNNSISFQKTLPAIVTF